MLRVGSLRDRTPGDGHRDRVRHLGARPARRQPDGRLLAGGQRLRERHHQGAPGPLGLRGGVAAARRPRLRPEPAARRPQPAHRRGPRPGQRDPHQRRPAVRRPRPPGVLHARGDHAARHRAVGQGGGAGHARRRPDGGADPGQHPDPPLQEQHRQQGRVVRRPRELPDEPGDAVRRHRASPHAVLREPAGGGRAPAGSGSGRTAASTASSSASAPTTSRSRSGSRPRSSDRSSTPATSRTPTRRSTAGCT